VPETRDSDTTAPGKPGNVTGEQTKEIPKEAELRWDAAEDNFEIHYYRILRSGRQEQDEGEQGACEYDKCFATVAFDNQKTFETYTIQAIDQSGNIGESSDPIRVLRKYKPAKPALTISTVKWRTTKSQRTVRVSFKAKLGSFTLTATKRGKMRKGACKKATPSTTVCSLRLSKGSWKLQLNGKHNGYRPFSRYKPVRF